MLPVHERLAELYNLSCHRHLTAPETIELQQCLKVNARYCWDVSCLNNIALLAAATGDTMWQQEVETSLTYLRLTGKTVKRK